MSDRMNTYLRNVTDHVEGNLGQMVVLAGENFGESRDGLFHGDELAGVASEDLGDLERLREETLDLASASDGQFVLFRQLVHTCNNSALELRPQCKLNLFLSYPKWR